jgi:hypothetical protein
LPRESAFLVRKKTESNHEELTERSVLPVHEF